MHSPVNESFDVSVVGADSDVIFCLDAALRLTSCNAAWDLFARENGAPEWCRPTPLGRSVLDYLPEPDREYYARAFRRVLAQAQPWEHVRDCSFPNGSRQFRVRVLPLMRQVGLMVIISLPTEQAFQRVPCTPTEERYRNGQGLIRMCCGCRRTRRPAPGEENWEWVPHFVERMPAGVSHGLCSPCREHYYPEED
jgi:hypothetical protein